MSALRLLSKKLIFICLVGLFSSTLSYSAAFYDNVDDEIDCGSKAVLDNLGPFTLSMWVKPTSQGAGGNFFCSKTDVNGNGTVYLRFNQPGTNALQFTKSGSTAINVVSSNNAISLGVWSHVCVTWTGSTTATTVKIYVNGSEVTYVTQTNGVTLGTDASNNFKIGNTTGDDRSFDGQISDVYLWNIVLTPTQIKQISLSRIKGTPLQISPESLIGEWPINHKRDYEIMSGDSSVTDFSPRANHGTPTNNIQARAEEWLSYP